MPNEYPTTAWWNAPSGEVSRHVLTHVRVVDNLQAELMDKFLKLEAAYDANPRTSRHTVTTTSVIGGKAWNRGRSLITENLIAKNVDTVAANVGVADIRVRIQTDGADWSHQRNAKGQEKYLNGLAELYEVGPKCRTGLKAGAALKGTGLNKVWTDEFEQVRVTPVPVDCIVVDELECRDGRPKQLHYRDFVDREELAQQFPEHAEAIRQAQSQGSWTRWAGYRPLERHQLVVIESWRLPIGPKGHPRYKPGRHTLVIDGCDLFDEEYHKPHYPFAKLVWNDPVWGWYGISLAERILPHQNLLNRRNWQINESLNRAVSPIWWVPQNDANLATKTYDQIGAFGVYKTEPPKAIAYQAVGAETYQSKQQIKSDAQEEARVDRGFASGSVSPGIQSGVGVREARITNSQPFSQQERAFEQFWLDTLWLVLDACKDLGGTKAPDILRVSKYGNRRIKWSEVDMNDLKIEMCAASSISDSPQGRQERVNELAQSGVISLDEARKLMDHPDIERVLSLYNAMLEDIEWTIERIEDGEEGVVPEPYQNLAAGCALMQKEYLLIRNVPNVPESVLDGLTDWIAIAANILNPAQPAQNGNMPAAAAGGSAMPQGPAAQAAAAAPTFAPGAYAPMVA